jgi:hypothetical protein
MNFTELKQMIEADLKLDETALDRESSRTPQLHNKYLTFYMDEKLRLKKLQNEQAILRRNLWLYYTGRMSQEELQTLGWEPFQLNVLKTEADDLITSDQHWIKLDERVSFQEEKVEYLENIVKIINNRQWQIRSMIDWIKFTQGV